MDLSQAYESEKFWSDLLGSIDVNTQKKHYLNVLIYIK